MQTYIQIMIVVCHAYNTSNNIGYANVLVGGKPFTLPLQSQLLGTIFKFMMMLKVVRIPNTSAIVPFFCILVSTSSKDSSRQTSFVFHLQDTWFQHFFHLFFSLSTCYQSLSWIDCLVPCIAMLQAGSLGRQGVLESHLNCGHPRPSLVVTFFVLP